MAKELHSLRILNSISFSMLSGLQDLSNKHMASILVKDLSQDIRETKKYIAFLELLRKEPSLDYVCYKMHFLSKYLIKDLCILHE